MTSTSEEESISEQTSLLQTSQENVSGNDLEQVKKGSPDYGTLISNYENLNKKVQDGVSNYLNLSQRVIESNEKAKDTHQIVVTGFLVMLVAMILMFLDVLVSKQQTYNELLKTIFQLQVEGGIPPSPITNFESQTVPMVTSMQVPINKGFQSITLFDN